MSTRAMTRAFLCLFALAAASQAVAGERPWKTVTTPNYRLISQLNDRETTKWMKDFDQFILSTSDVLKMNLSAMPPLTVVIFDRDKDFEPYRLLKPDGTTAAVAGQFVRRPTWSMIGMAHDTFDEEGRRTIYHEATHWLMSIDQSRHPAWFSEGIAEVFSTFERRGEKVNWAKPIGYHLSVLTHLGDLPMVQFLTAPDAIFNQDKHTGIFYAQSWAFTHFMLFSKDSARREQLTQFLQVYRTQSGEATVTTVFGSGLLKLEQDFFAYSRQRTWGYMIQPLKPAPEPPAPQPASAALVESSLGFLALGSGRDELAQHHAEKAIALDANSPDGYEILAYLAVEKRDIDKAANHAEAALERGSKDSNLYMLLGDAHEIGSASRKPNALQSRINLYEKAINMESRRLEVYERLTEALFKLEKPREEDRKFLEVGLRIFPGEDWLRVGTAIVNYRLGQHEAAMTTIDHVLRPESPLDEAQRAYATNVKRSWLLDTMNSEIKSAMSKNDVPAARAIVVRYRTTLGNDQDVSTFLDQVDSSLLDVQKRQTKLRK